MKSSAKHLLGAGLLLVAGLPMLAAYGGNGLAAQPARPLQAVVAQATPEATPAMPTQSIANFTRADYEAALAKWRAQDAALYRIEVTYSAFSLARGPWRLTVGRDDAREFITAFERQDGSDTGGVLAETLEWLTIGNIFDQIDQALRNVENPSADQTAFEYTASFHPTLGYPTSFTAVPRSNLVADADFAFEVQSVTVLQTGVYVPGGGVVPGMPSTGYSDR